MMKPEPSEEKQATKEEATAKRGNKRKRGAHPAAKASVKPESGSEEDTVTSDETNEVIDNPRAKRKSILQLAGSKFSKKAAGRRRSLPPIDVEVTEPDGEVESPDSGLAEEDTPALPPTNSKQISSHTRSHQPTTEASPALYHDYLPRKYADVKVVEYDLPSCQPDQPGDLWTCPFDTCNHKVQEASTAAGNASIKDHFQAHAKQAQEKIDLVYKESRPYLPVEFVFPFPFSFSFFIFIFFFSFTHPHHPLSPYHSSNPRHQTKALIFTRSSTQQPRPSSPKLRPSPRYVFRLILRRQPLPCRP